MGPFAVHKNLVWVLHTKLATNQASGSCGFMAAAAQEKGTGEAFRWLPSPLSLSDCHGALRKWVQETFKFPQTTKVVSVKLKSL